MFYIIGIGLTFFLDFLLITKKGKTTADKILAAWLFTMGLHLTLFYFRFTSQPPFLLAVDFPLPLMHGPFLFWYTIALTKPLANHRYQLFHFLPAAACYIYLIHFFILPVEEKILIFQNQGKGYEVFNDLRFIAIVISGFGYVVASEVVLHKHRKAILYQFSSTEKINLDWLRYWILGIGLIWVFVLYEDENLLFTVVVLFVLFIGYFGIRQVGIFTSPPSATNASREPEVKELQEEESIDKQKYQKSGLTREAAEQLQQRLFKLMADEKLYTQSELSLSDLAGRLETPSNHLSQMLNDLEGKSFYDYINTLRIEEFKRLAANPENEKYSLMGLANSSGFNSKSTFNRYFKKVTGLAPSEYLKSTASIAS